MLFWPVPRMVCLTCPKTNAKVRPVVCSLCDLQRSALFTWHSPSLDAAQRPRHLDPTMDRSAGVFARPQYGRTRTAGVLRPLIWCATQGT
jgi:hypothetical protein